MPLVARAQRWYRADRITQARSGGFLAVNCATWACGDSKRKMRSNKLPCSYASQLTVMASLVIHIAAPPSPGLARALWDAAGFRFALCPRSFHGCRWKDRLTVSFPTLSQQLCPFPSFWVPRPWIAGTATGTGGTEGDETGLREKRPGSLIALRLLVRFLLAHQDSGPSAGAGSSRIEPSVAGRRYVPWPRATVQHRFPTRAGRG